MNSQKENKDNNLPKHEENKKDEEKKEDEDE